MDSKLNLYFQDIEDIFEEVKRKYDYNGFTITGKSKFDPVIFDMISASKDCISKVYTNTEFAVNLLCEIQNKLDKTIMEFRIADQIFQDSIYRMSLNYHQDSCLAYGYNEQDWIFTIKN